MTPEEVEVIIDRLRDAADNLSAVRGNIANLKAQPYRGKYRLSELRNGKIDVEERLAHIEAILLQALEPLDDYR